MSSKIINYFFFGVLIIAVYFMVLHRLGAFPMQLWDEARLSNNAIEMSMNNNFLVTYFDGNPEMWNTKPPLMIWCMVASIKAFGYNELALRLPSALAGIATLVFIFIFSYKLSGNFYLGVLSILTLLTTSGYVGFHVLKTADYDAVLTLFMTLYAFMYFLYLYYDLKERKYIYLFVLFLCLAMLTKGIAPLMLLPALFIYTLFEKKTQAVLMKVDFWIGCGIFLACIIGYYLLREQYNPGYIAAVIENEITGRYLEHQGGNDYPFDYYLTNILNGRYQPWIYLFPFSVFICFISKSRVVRNLLGFCLINSLTFFLIISSSMTKLEWYDAPVFPFLAMINGCAFWIIFQRIIDNMKFSLRKEFLFPAFVFLIFFLPYKENIKNVFALPEKYFNPEVQFSSLMNELKISHPELRKYTVIPGCVAMYHGQVSFFVKAFNSQGYSLNIGFLRDNNLKPFSYALTSDENTKWLLQTMYNYKIIATYKDCILYQIISGLEPYPDAILKLTKLKIHTSISWMNAISKERGSNFERELHSNAIHYLESTHNITSEEGNYLKLKLPDERK